MPEPVAFKYRAFISYSHADTRWAKWLHGRLESYRIDGELVGRETTAGPIPKSLRPVFRDRHDFQAGHSLTEQTMASLDASASLVVLCTPKAAASEYVNDEIRIFRSRHPDRPVVPLIIEGQPGSADEECFPPALRFELQDDGSIGHQQRGVIAADIREQGDGRELAFAKVVAGILGLPPDDVFRRAQRERARLQRKWIIGLSLVAVSLAGLAVWAEVNRREAVRNFSLAKQGADALVVDIARGLRDVEGMRAEAVRTILGRADKVISGLVAGSGEDQELLRSQAAMLNEFVDTYIAVGDTDSAANAARLGLEVSEKIAKNTDADLQSQRALGRGMLKLGDAYIEIGEFKKARQSYSDSLKWRKKIASSHPDNLKAYRDVSVSLNRLGELEEILAQFENAKAYFEEGLKIRLTIVERKPEWKRDLVVSNIKLGDVTLASNDFAAARAYFEKALGFARQLAENKNNTKNQRDLAVVYQRLGNLGLESEDSEMAEQAFNDSLASFGRLAGLDPGNVEWQRDIAVSFMKLGHAAKLAGRTYVARQRYAKCSKRLRELLAKNADNVQWRIDLAEALMHSAEVSTANQRRSLARQALEMLDRLRAEEKSGNEQEKWSAKLKAMLAG